MIIIVTSEDAAPLSKTLANVSSAKFGAKQAISLYLPPLARDEDLYLVATLAAFNSSNAPVIGDHVESWTTNTIGATMHTNGHVWTVQSLVHQLEDVFPERYNGSVHLAVASRQNYGAVRDFAGMFKTLLTGERQVRGNVFYHPGDTVGPIFPAGDTRWQGVRALPVVASPMPKTRLQLQQQIGWTN